MEHSIAGVQETIESMKGQIRKVIKGQEELIENTLIAVLAGGHILIEGVPGLGKTLLANTLSHVVGGTFKRIQFTPDLMPTDIIGTTVYDMETKSFRVKYGPIFTNFLLADEINRSPAKTQSALLQAMQEKKVTIDGKDYPLSETFTCLATQNPIEMEGTYPLPEAQIDRFLLKVLIDYPSREEEKNILKHYREGFQAETPESAGLEKVIDEEGIQQIKRSIQDVIVDDKIIDYITDIVSATRHHPGIEIGSSPRGNVALFQTARVKAFMEGRDFVIPDDVKSMAYPALRHRLILEAEAEIEGYASDDYLKKILEEVEIPR